MDIAAWLRRRGETPVLALSVLTGVLVALVVAGFEWLAAEQLLEEVLHRPLWQVALAPSIGLILAPLILRYVGRQATTATSDEFNRAFHERNPRLPFKHFFGKLLAGVATIGSGGAVGLEGPSVYAGSTIGLGVRDRMSAVLRRDDARLLLTAGAAAGIAAVFKAPATGVLFALEAPYRDDVTRKALLPSLLAAAASYITYVNIIGTEPVVPFLNDPQTRLGLGEAGDVLTDGSEGALVVLDRLDELFFVQVGDVFGAVLIGILAGLGGRAFAWLIRWSKTIAKTRSVWPRVVSAGLVLAGLAVLADELFEANTTIGPGFEAMKWVIEPEQGLGLIAVLFGMRVAATMATVAGGGVGGLFIPLATQGVILGAFVGDLINSESGLYPTLGLAAFLGAGYRAPISAVMFVAESSGGSFVVPALVAAAVSQIVAGPSSVAEHQRSVRLGHLERRFTLPITSALTTDVMTVPPDATMSEFVYMHVLGRRERSVPVVDKGEYLGMMNLRSVSDVDRSTWDELVVRAFVDQEAPAARPSWTLRDAVATMEANDLDVLAVTDSESAFIGVIYADDILKLDEILDETGG